MTRLVDYDVIAPRYDARFSEHDHSGIEQTLTDLVTPRTDVLDVGCGTGRWLRHVVGLGARAVGLDASRGMLARARAQSAESVLVQGLATRLPFAMRSFDTLYAVNVLHHVQDVRAFLSEAFRVLRPGGRILSIGLDPARGEDEWYVYDFFPGTRERDAARYARTEDLRELMLDLGFVDAETFVAQQWDEEIEARTFIGRGGASQTMCSQLALLTSAEHEAGLRRIQSEVSAARSRREPFMLTGRLKLFATCASVPGAEQSGSLR